MVGTFAGLTGHVVTALQLFVTATSYATEANPDTRARYSKFSRAGRDGDGKAASTTTWPSRLAMTVIYAPAAVAAATLATAAPSLPVSLCVVHFVKRCMEVAFLHQYSGRTDRATPTMIGAYYALIVLLVARAGDDGSRGVRAAVGAGTCALGLLGNLYHHYLLASLRGSSSGVAKTRYVAPRGGLFSHVACPHYLCELVGWLGIAIAAHHVNVYLVVASMCSYLGGRSAAQNAFNRAHFPEWTEGKKNLIPFVF